MGFIGLELHDPAPDGKTVWLSHEQPAAAGCLNRLYFATMYMVFDPDEKFCSGAERASAKARCPY